MEDTNHRPTWKTLLAFAIIYFVWGSTFLAIRVGVREVPPLVLAAMRFSVAGLVLFGWVLARGERAPSGREWRSASILGMVIFVFDYGLLFWAEQRVPSGIAAVMLATIPVFMALCEIIFLRTQRLTVRLALALLIGIGGVGVLMSHTLNLGGAPIDKLGAMALIFASISWSIASVLARKLPLPSSKVMSSGAQMLCGGILLAIAAGAVGGLRKFFSPAGFRGGGRVRRIQKFSSLVRFARGVARVALSDRCGFDHRFYGVRVADPSRIAHESRHLRLCESDCSRAGRIFSGRRSAHRANHPGNFSGADQCNSDHNHANEETSGVSPGGRRGITVVTGRFDETVRRVRCLGGVASTSATSRSAAAPGCEIPADAPPREMVRKFRQSRSSQSFHNPASCHPSSRSLRCSRLYSAAFPRSCGSSTRF